MSLALIASTTGVPPGTLAPTVQIIHDLAGLATLASEWNELYQRSPTAAPPLSWDWVSGWWRHYGATYGQHGTGLRILAVRRGSSLLGLLPLYQGRLGAPIVGARRLGFVSTGEAEFEGTYPEYLDLLHAPGEAETCCRSLARVLLESSQLRWDELHLYELAAESPLVGLAPLLQGGGRRVSVRPSSACSLADTTGGFEEYLKRLSHENRRQGRKMLRDAEKQDARLELAAAHQVEEFFEQMLHLHRKRWQAVGEAGAFAPRHAQFHRELADKMVPRGDAILARLSHDGKPLALVYGYRTGEKLHCYQQGVDNTAGPLRSPGTTIWLMLMRRLHSEGVVLFDHQKGMTTFKERFCLERRPMVDLRVVRPTPRALTHLLSDFTCRATRKAFRVLSRLTQRTNAESDPPGSPSAPR